jgi:hypothetical protein
MSKETNPGELGAEIAKQIGNYNDDVKKAIEKETRSTARKLKNEIKDNSPELTGDYKAGWSYSTSKKHGKIITTVYNKDKPSLTHLLEKGHAIAGGKDRVKAYKHIGPAEEKYISIYNKRIEEIIKNGGR